MSLPVLVVEDGRTDRKFHREILEGAGYRVVEAANGYEGWERVLAEDFDLLLADVNMPKLDGLSLTRLLRTKGRETVLPILLVSSDGGREGREQGFAAGADGYLVKPLRPQDLISAVQEAAGVPS